MSVVLYSTEGCPACIKARAFLRAHRVSFTDKRVDADVAAANEAAQLALGRNLDPTSVPILAANGHVTQGFDADRWTNFIRGGALGDLNMSITSSPVWRVLSMVSAGLSAYHGYKRNDSIGWAIVWGLLGGIFPVITPAIGFAQGFGKRAHR